MIPSYTDRCSGISSVAGLSFKVGGVGLLLLLFAYSLFLGQNRIYQVDEAQTLYMAKVVGAGETTEFFTTAALSLLGPLAWLASSDLNSNQIFSLSRLLFVGVFWYNVVLSAYLAGGSFRKPKGLISLLVAASLAPLWDFGFEIRHDNLILSFVLTSFWMIRAKPLGAPSIAIAGCLLACMPFLAFKAFVFAGPLFILSLLMLKGDARNGFRREVILLTSGMLISTILIVGLYFYSGLWDILVSGVSGGVDASVVGHRFWVMDALMRAWVQCPVLSFITVVMVTVETVRFLRFSSGFFKGFAQFSAFGLLLIGCFALFINPTPFPYNLVNVVPFAMMFVVGRISELIVQWRLSSGRVAMVCSVLLGLHLISFQGSALRHLHWTNQRQRLLMETAEEMSGPEHRIYDAVGLVPSRKSIHYNWYLHSLNVKAFVDGSLTSVPEMVRTNPPVVIIPNYRTNWLPEDDQAGMLMHHVPLSDDFWVLGVWMEGGSGQYEVMVGGRYALILEGDKKGEVWIDGVPHQAGVVFLEKGTHQLESVNSGGLAVVWLGPLMDQLPDLGQKPRLPLFVNWY